MRCESVEAPNWALARRRVDLCAIGGCTSGSVSDGGVLAGVAEGVVDPPVDLVEALLVGCVSFSEDSGPAFLFSRRLGVEFGVLLVQQQIPLESHGRSIGPHDH
jgi:hypothetical protein